GEALDHTRLPAVERKDPGLSRVRTIGEEHETRALGRDPRPTVRRGSVRQLLRPPARRRNPPETRPVPIALDRLPGVDGVSAVGGQVEAGDPDLLAEIRSTERLRRRHRAASQPRPGRDRASSDARYAWRTMVGTDQDLGYFGPDSVSWQVDREITVLFGGARALLLQAAHPLVVAGVNQTGMYDRNPWKRLQRTLVLTYAITFGTRAEAQAAAGKINEGHSRVN